MRQVMSMSTALVMHLLRKVLAEGRCAIVDAMNLPVATVAADARSPAGWQGEPLRAL